MGQTCFFLGHQLLLRISVLLTIPAHHSFDAQFKEVRDILLPLVQGFKDLDKHSRLFVRPWYCHLQNYWCRIDRQCPLCQFGFICKDGAKCQRPFTERLLQFPCEQVHAGVSTWFDKFLATADIPAANKPIEIHCKTGSRSARLVFETRARCREFVVRFKDDGIQCLHWCANQNYKMIVKLENDLRHFGMPCLKWKSTRTLPWKWYWRYFHCAFSRCSSTGPQHLRSLKRRWKTCVQTCTTGTRPNVCYHCSSCVWASYFWWWVATSHVSSKPIGSELHGQCVMATPSPPRLSATWRVEAPFSAALRSGVFFELRSICAGVWPFMTQHRRSVHASCGRPFDITSCFFHSAQRLGKCWL